MLSSVVLNGCLMTPMVESVVDDCYLDLQRNEDGVLEYVLKCPENEPSNKEEKSDAQVIKHKENYFVWNQYYPGFITSKERGIKSQQGWTNSPKTTVLVV